MVIKDRAQPRRVKQKIKTNNIHPPQGGRARNMNKT
jgi:hypothetical protein